MLRSLTEFNRACMCRVHSIKASLCSEFDSYPLIDTKFDFDSLYSGAPNEQAQFWRV